MPHSRRSQTFFSGIGMPTDTWSSWSTHYVSRLATRLEGVDGEVGVDVLHGDPVDHNDLVFVAGKWKKCIIGQTDIYFFYCNLTLKIQTFITKKNFKEADLFFPHLHYVGFCVLYSFVVFYSLFFYVIPVLFFSSKVILTWQVPKITYTVWQD